MATRTLILMVATLLLAPVARADGKPYVAVRFEITGPTFKAGLGDRAPLETKLAEAISSTISKRFRFADWPAKPAGPEGKLGALVMRLEEEAANIGPRVVLRWYGDLGTGSVDRLPMETIVLYPPTDPGWPTNNPAELESQVIGKLLPAIETDGFADGFLAKFIRQLPLAQSVDPRADDHVIVLPLKWADVGLGDETTIMVKFVKPQGEVSKRGTVSLDLISERLNDPGKGHIEGGVKSASIGAQPITLQDRWSPELLDLLNGAQVKCFLVDYHPSEFGGTSGGLVTGGGQ